jgi:hypothetical protein
MRRLITLLSSALLITGCASKIMQAYVGQPISAVVEDYGMPSGAFDIEPGKRAFVWSISTNIFIPGATTTYGTAIGNQLFLNSYSSPGVMTSDSCNYVLYAEKHRSDIEGPAAWRVTSFKKPGFWCE